MKKTEIKKIRSTNSGFISLVSVIVLDLVALVIIVTSLSLQMDNAKINKLYSDSLYAGALADTCAEIGLDKLKADINYSGSESFSYFGGSCDIGVILGVGNNNRTLQVMGSYEEAVRRVRIEITIINPTTVITSWQDVTN